MSTNHITLTGQISGIETALHGYDGLHVAFTLFTGEWWHDRQDRPHMLHVPVRMPSKLLAGQELDEGLFVQVEGRLNQWSIGQRFDGGRAVTRIEAEQITVLAQDQPADPPTLASEAEKQAT